MLNLINQIYKYALPFKISKEIDYIIQQRCIKLIKSDSTDTCNVTKDFYFK